MALNFKEIVKNIETELGDPSKPWTPFFKTVEEKTSMKRTRLLLVMMICLFIYLAFGYASHFVCYWFGIAYPLVKSMEALDTQDPGKMKKWLIYWMVFTSATFFDIFAKILSIKFFWVVKAALQVWWMLPIDNNGSMICYKFLFSGRSFKKELKEFTAKNTEIAKEILPEIGDQESEHED